MLFLYSLFFYVPEPVLCSSHGKRQGHERKISTMQANFKALFMVHFLMSHFSKKVTWSSPKSRRRHNHNHRFIHFRSMDNNSAQENEGVRPIIQSTADRR